MSRPRVATVQAGGTAIAYVRAGAGSPVVLVHGNLASHRFWQELIAAPPDGCELIAPDLPNFGASGRLPGEVSMVTYGDALAALLETLELPPVTLVGHSLGGAVAQACAGRRPQAVARLMLVDSPPPAGFHAPEASLRGAEILAAEPSVEARRAMIGQALPATMPARTPTYLAELIDEALKIPTEVIMPNAEALERMDLRELVRAYHGPVLVLRGGQDALITPALAEATVAAYGEERTRLVTWDDVGHSPQVEAPARFATLLAEFVGEPP